MEKDDKGSTMIWMGVSGWMSLLVPAYPGCPGSRAIKRSLLLLFCSFYAFETSCYILTIISGSTFVLYLLTPSIVLSGIIMLSAESKTQSIFLIFILFFYYIILYYFIILFYFILLFFIIYIFIFHSKIIHRVYLVLFLWFIQDHMMHSLSWYPVGCLSTAACFEGPLETGLIWM